MLVAGADLCSACGWRDASVFLLLIRIRIASIVNIARDQFRRSPTVFIAMAMLGALLFSGILSGFLFLFRISMAVSSLTETLYQVFYFLFLFLLAGSTPFVASTLLHSADYSLLFSAPVPPRTVVAAKLVDAAVTNSLQFLVLGVPVLVAAAFALDATLLAWLMLPAVTALFILLPALVTALGLLVLLALFGAARLRSAVSLLNALMACVACFTIVLESPHLPIRPGMDALFAAASGAGHASASARLMPSAWFVDALAALSHADEVGAGAAAAGALAKIVALNGGLWLGCVALGRRLISAANLAEESSMAPAEAGADLAGSRQSSPVRAILGKDWRYLKRDSILLSQLTMPLILYAVPFILILQDPSRRTYGETFFFCAVIIAIIVFMQTSILSLSSIGLESRAFWIILTAPTPAMDLVTAKFLLSALFSGSTGAVLTLVAALLFGVRPAVLLIELVVVVVSAAALSGLGVGIAAAFPRFVYENPAHRVSVWALVLGFFASMTYVLVSGILFAAAWVIAVNFPPGTGQIAAFSIASGLYLFISAAAVWAPIRLGARRLEGYQWEH